jgi:hypothetical protein
VYLVLTLSLNSLTLSLKCLTYRRSLIHTYSLTDSLTAQRHRGPCLKLMPALCACLKLICTHARTHARTHAHSRCEQKLVNCLHVMCARS